MQYQQGYQERTKEELGSVLFYQLKALTKEIMYYNYMKFLYCILVGVILKYCTKRLYWNFVLRVNYRVLEVKCVLLKVLNVECVLLIRGSV